MTTTGARRRAHGRHRAAYDIRPAAYCGNVALKPTQGAINRGERQATSMSTHLRLSRPRAPRVRRRPRPAPGPAPDRRLRFQRPERHAVRAGGDGAVMAAGGLPVGVQVMGQPLEDARMTALARWLLGSVTPAVAS